MISDFNSGIGQLTSNHCPSFLLYFLIIDFSLSSLNKYFTILTSLEILVVSVLTQENKPKNNTNTKINLNMTVR